MDSPEARQQALLTYEQFDLISCQGTVFTPDNDLSLRPILSDILPRWIGRFDGEPSVLGGLAGAPPEVPRVILTSKDHRWACEIAPARMNLFRRKSRDDGALQADAIFSEIASLVRDYVLSTAAGVGRVAGVVSSVVSLDNPGKRLAEHFCKDRWQDKPLNRPEGFEIHAHKRFRLGKRAVNSWVRNRVAQMQVGTDSIGDVILVEQDINSLQEESNVLFSADETDALLAAIASEFRSILALYYPVNQ